MMIALSAESFRLCVGEPALYAVLDFFQRIGAEFTKLDHVDLQTCFV